MELILKEDVENLGFKDDLVVVKNGYGRNFLIPQGKAILATISAKKVLAEKLKQSQVKEKQAIEEANKIVKKLESKIKDTNKMRTKQTLHNVQSYHTTSSEVGKVAFITNSKKLILTHFVPTRFNKVRLKNIIKKDFGKDPIIGEDLMTIKI